MRVRRLLARARAPELHRAADGARLVDGHLLERENVHGDGVRSVRIT